MEAEKILEITLREMSAIGQGWRANWGDFDGRTLRDQLNSLAQWARDAAGVTGGNYTLGTEFLHAQENPRW